MHMARLYDTSRLPSEFSLSKLTEIYYEDIMEVRNHYLKYFRKNFINEKNNLIKFDVYEKFNDGVLKKIDMKTLFSYKKILKNGEEGKSWVMPDLEELHTSPKFIQEWIKYSVIDAEATYYLRDALQLKLQSLSAETLGHTNPVNSICSNNYHIYLNFWRPFGELLTDMERNGIYIDVNYLKVIFKLIRIYKLMRKLIINYIKINSLNGLGWFSQMHWNSIQQALNN
jgi:DNA polymerase-1